MEPRKEDKVPEPRVEEKKPKRFRLVRLEERIAPSGGGHTPRFTKHCSF